MSRTAIACLALCACGRLGFDGAPTARDAAPSPDSTDDPSLLFHLDFESSTAPLSDATGHGHDAVCETGCPPIILERGGHAALFANAQGLRVPDAPELRPAVFTFAAWVRFDAIEGHTMFSRPLEGQNGVMNTWELWADSTIVNLSAMGDSFDRPHPGLGTWHHYAGTYDGLTLLAYRDGARVGSLTVDRATAYGADHYYIGCDRDNGVTRSFFVGALDDLRLYGKVLTDAEIGILATP